MRKLWLASLAVFFLIAGREEGYSQLNRKSIKRNNKRISSFKGKKSHFGKDKIYNAVGFSANALNYYGDIAPRPQRISTDISFTKPGLGISFAHRFGPRYTLQGQFMYGVLKGGDNESADKNDMENGVFRYKRNLSFRNHIKEFSVVAVLDLFKNQGNYISRAKWTPYIFLGVAGYLHNPQGLAPATGVDGVTPLAEAGQWVKLRPLGTEGQYSNLASTDVNFGNKPYKLMQFAIPFGLGVRLRVNEVIDLWGDLGFRYTFTDYLDDVSQNYVDLGVLNSELARAMSYRTNELKLSSSTRQYTGRNGIIYTVENGYGEEIPPTDGIGNRRGSKNDRDIYMVTSIRLTYILGATFHRAKFR
jgi:Domain of unknown function (DUF6089)